MKFPYVKVRGFYMPLILVKLQRGEHSISVWGLVDSGAGGNIFDAQLAKALGITNLAEDGIEARFESVTGQTLKGYRHDVTLEIGGNRFVNVNVAFTEHMPDNATGILGQDGFFDLFPVKFTYRKREIELMSAIKPKRRK